MIKKWFVPVYGVLFHYFFFGIAPGDQKK